MADVKIYVKSWCGYSKRALALLDKEGIPYEKIDVTEDADLEREMVQAANGRTSVPQVFIGSEHVGGSDDLSALAAKGTLKEMVAR